MIKSHVSLFLSIVLLSLIVFQNPSSAQSRTGILRGIVTDSTNGEPLPYANIVVKNENIGTTTDENGFFIIPALPLNKSYRIVISYVGYIPIEVPVNLRVGTITTMHVGLSPAKYQLETVEKIGERSYDDYSTDIGLEKIVVKDIDKLPQGVESDIFRSLQYLPGVRSSGDVSARYYVRGGAADQNLVLYNGAPLYSPFHALGLFSAVDPATINNVEFYKGGFPAEYGGRLSSVLNFFPRDGNKRDYSAKASISLLTTKALIEGPIPDGSFFLSGRKNYSHDVLNKFLNDKDLPIDFFDISFRANYSNSEVMKNSKFSTFGFISEDKILNENVTKEDVLWRNSVFGFSWFQITDSPIFYTMNLSFSNFYGEVKPKQSAALYKLNEIRDVTFFMDFNSIISNIDELQIGMKINTVSSKLVLENDYGLRGDIGSKGTHASVYVKYRLLRIKGLGLDMGSRINMASLSTNSEVQSMLEPRIRMAYKLFDWLTFKAASGYFVQDMTTLIDESEIISLFDPWIITPNYIGSSSSKHYIAGLESQIHETTNLDIEAYYKENENISVVNENKMFFNDRDFISGAEESYGLEAMLSYTNHPLRLSVAYSWSRAFREVAGHRYRPKYDAQNVVNIVAEYYIGAGFNLSAAWTYNSGIPFTQIKSFYDKYYFNDIGNWYSVLDSYEAYKVLAGKNAATLPDYHRLDISLSKKFVLGFATFTIDASIINVYDRNNLFYFDRETGERVDMLPFLPSVTIKAEL